MTELTKKALIVDDEEALREIIVEVLSIMKIEALTAENGVQAIEVAKKNRERINLMLIDLFMPKMTGDEAYKKLSQIVPDCPVIFMSGYDDQEEDRPAEPGKLFLKKPFAISDLKKAITSLIG